LLSSWLSMLSDLFMLLSGEVMSPLSLLLSIFTLVDLSLDLLVRLGDEAFPNVDSSSSIFLPHKLVQLRVKWICLL